MDVRTMTIENRNPDANPDQYARDLHKALLLDGPRSATVRRLNRVARKNPGAELERIFETKVAEFKRHHRETRVPTWRNAPQRAVEWVMEQSSFTPPKDVLMTLVYVVIALLSVEFGKGFFGYDKSARASRSDDSIRMPSLDLFDDSTDEEGENCPRNIVSIRRLRFILSLLSPVNPRLRILKTTGAKTALQVAPTTVTL